MDRPELITALDPPDSPARVDPPEREPLRVGLVQHRWHPDPDEHRAALAEGIRIAAGAGRAPGLPPGAHALAVLRGDRRRARRGGGHGRGHSRTAPRPPSPRELAAETGAYVHASLYERADVASWVQHGDLRGAVRRAGRPDAQAAHPGHRRLLRGPLLPARRLGLSGGRTRRRRIRLPDLLGPVVPRAGTRLLAGRCRGDRVPDRDRLRARPPAASTPSRCGSG